MNVENEEPGCAIGCLDLYGHYTEGDIRVYASISDDGGSVDFGVSRRMRRRVRNEDVEVWVPTSTFTPEEIWSLIDALRRLEFWARMHSSVTAANSHELLTA